VIILSVVVPESGLNDMVLVFIREIGPLVVGTVHILFSAGDNLEELLRELQG